MFTVWRLLAESVLTPKNGPVLERRVNGYAATAARGLAGSIKAVPVPEPSVVCLLAFGLVIGAGLFRRGRQPDR